MGHPIGRGGMPFHSPWSPTRALTIVCVSLTVILTGCQASSSAATAAEQFTPQGWQAHSAYGLQVSVPESWAVHYFASCPDSERSGTLLIGAPKVAPFCTFYGSNTNMVSLYSEPSQGANPTDPQNSGPAAKSFTIHGVRVTPLSGPPMSSDWLIPSRDAVVRGMGPKALAIMRTLAPATQNATQAPGTVDGTIYVNAVERVPASGTVTVREVGSK